MLIDNEVVESIEASVLCWLATVGEDGSPNVSPKEAFTHDGNGRLLIAHIASPQSVKNIESNPSVCVSFVDVFVQKGYKVRGKARVVSLSDESFGKQQSRLKQLAGDAFPICAVIEVTPTAVEEIIAPSYHLIPGVTTEKMIDQSLSSYRVVELQRRKLHTGSQSLSDLSSELATQQILVYSDSLSWGIVPGTRHRLPFERRWPGVMELALRQRGAKARVIEDCLNGRRTALDDPLKPGRNGLEGIEQRIEVNSPLGLVVVMLGTNDFQAVHSIDARQSATNVASIVDAVRKAPIEPEMPVPSILVVAPPPLEQPKGEMAAKFDGAAEKSKGLAAAYEQVARNHDCQFLDAGQVTGSSKIDGVHLDEGQHRTLGLAVADLIMPPTLNSLPERFSRTANTKTSPIQLPAGDDCSRQTHEMEDPE